MNGLVSRIGDRLSFAFRVAICKVRPVIVRCPHCLAISAHYIPSLASPTHNIKCPCGKTLELREADMAACEAVNGLLREHRIVLEARERKRAQEQLVQKFHAAEEDFDRDWAFYCDPAMPVKIARMKEQTEWLYKKLSACNSRRMIHAQHEAAAAAYETAITTDAEGNEYVGLPTEMSYCDCRGEEREEEKIAEDIQSHIDRNENIFDRYDNLCVEFAEKSRDQARSVRLTNIFGFSDAASLPPPIAPVESNADAELASIRTMVSRGFDAYWKGSYTAWFFMFAILLVLACWSGSATMGILAVACLLVTTSVRHYAESSDYISKIEGWSCQIKY